MPSDVKGMTVHTWFRQAEQDLTAAGITTPRLDTQVLLEDCLQTDRALLLAHPETTLTTEQISVLDLQVKRRARHEPLAYIRGHAEFYGRVFNVNKNVLVPRPESEVMIGLLKTLSLAVGTTIIDVGTGSGALAITAKLERPMATVVATDIDAACLDIARRNATERKAQVEFLQGNLLEPLHQVLSQNYIILANLPYVPDEYQVNQAAQHEPRLALFAGPDGLMYYRQLFQQLAAVETQARAVLAESLPEQHAALTGIARHQGYEQTAEDDFIQVFEPVG